MSYDLIISCCSATKSCPTLCNPMDCSREDSVSFTISPSLHKFLSIELVMSSNYLILCHPLPLCFPSIRVFSNEYTLCNRWPRYWSFSFIPSNEYSGLIFFRIDWFDPCSPRDSEESSPAPQFKSINSLALSLLYRPTCTSVHD